MRNDAKPAMVCSANNLQEWKDFPKGLRVLLVDGDSNLAEDVRSKLEVMDYIGQRWKLLFYPSSFLPTSTTYLLSFGYVYERERERDALDDKRLLF